MDLVIKNCRLVDRLGEYNIKVEDGKIAIALGIEGVVDARFHRSAHPF